MRFRNQSSPREACGGFTLVELIVVISLVAILTVIAIPYLLRTRTAANEAISATTLKAYAVAQTTFLSGKQGRITINSKAGINGYCDNFRNLFYGLNVGSNKNLTLISQSFADAFARIPGSNSAPTNNSPLTAATQPIPYQGFLFGEPKELILGSDNHFKTNFGLVAVPSVTGHTGFNAYWIGQPGMVMMTVVPIAMDYATAIEMQTPSDPAVPPNIWRVM